MRNRPIVWTPDENEKTHVRTFMDLHGIADYDAFIKKSETDIKWFWEAFIQFAGIQFSQPYEEIVDLTGGMVWPKWFTGGKINLVDNMLDKWAVNEETSERIAVMWEGEDGEARTYSYKQLYRETNRFANALHQLGIGKGERVAIFMPMIPETVIALYGIYKAGAVAVPLFSGFGPEAIALRLNDVEACAVVTADGFFRGGNKVLLKQTLDKALQSARTVRAVIVANRFGENHCTMTDRDYKWSELVGGSSDAFETVQTDAEDMCMVSYSSGTTGKPKGIVHVHGGIAVKTAEAGLFVFDVKEDEIFYMITDFGWMMGQLPLFMAHSVSACFFMYEGSPLYPHPGRIYELIDKYQVTSFAAPATALRMLKTYAEPYRKQASLSSLRQLGHTGEPIDEDTWYWYLEMAGRKLPIVNGSGGTELFAEILASTNMQPLKACCLGVTPAIGARVVDEHGEPVAPGKSGYLVHTLPQPAQTRGFWRNPDGYVETYFPLGPHYWWQGDMVMVDEEGFWFHLGRADDVIKVSGRRTGPSEIEDVINLHPDVMESAAIGVPHPVKGAEIVVFAVAVPGRVIEPEGLAQLVASSLGKPYEPGAVLVVKELPKTRTQKIVRRLIKQKYLGEPLGDRSSLLNPDALAEIPERVSTAHES